MKMSAILVLYIFLLGSLQHAVVSGEICQKSVCEYHFDIRHHRTMTYNKGFLKSFNAILNGSAVLLEPDPYRRPLPSDGDVGDDVITADGIRRNIITVNGMYPGPPIEVMEGAQVVVHVANHLLTQSLTIHWHGIHQQKTPWMDGTAFVSQCPILPRQSFTYRFFASPAGTHWYHDHIMGQRSDGQVGMLIVHKKQPVLPEVSLVVSDWFHFDSTTADLTNFFSTDGGAGDFMVPPPFRDYSHDVVEVSPYKYVSGLINGKGRFGGNMMPLSTTVLPARKTTRFRVVNSGAEFHYEMSIDQHRMQIVALDGQEIEPVTADSFIIAPGERFDFLLTSDQKPDNYWLHCKTLKDGFSPRLIKDGIEHVVYGIIRYEGVPEQDPTSVPKICSQSDNCLVFNCPWEGYPAAYNKRCIQPYEAKSTMSQRELDEQYGLKDEAYEEYILNFGFTFTAAINGVRFVEPGLPMSDPNYKKAMASCETEQCKQMNAGCRCTQTISIPYNKTIQMVFANYRPVPEGQFTVHAHHNIHLHGHNFAVLRMGFPTFNTTTGHVIKEDTDVVCDTPVCRRPRWNGPVPRLNIDKPQIKDTIAVPARGYVVLRFRSTNPGHWLLHCHIESHANTGMALIISEGVEQIPAPPENFPKCNPFEWSESQFSHYIDRSSKNGFNKIEPLNQTSPYSMPEWTTTTIAQQMTTIISDESIQLTRREFVGLIIGCIAFGAVLMFVPTIILLWVKAKYS